MKFEFSTATRIVFGCGERRHLAAAVRELGTRALVVCGSNPARIESVIAGLPSATAFSTSGEPTIHTVCEGVAMARDAGSDVVVAIGGGSAIDTGKAIAALVANGGGPLDYLEVVGAGRPLTRRPLPVVAIPTTAGAGAEVTRNAVLAVPDAGVKASLRSPWLFPVLALVDPELTLDLPANLTAATGMDALAQLIEPYTSCRANAMADLYCTEGIRLVSKWLRRAVDHPGDLEARTAMSLASLYGGIALTNAGLGAVHGFAAPIGGMFPAPHGAVCGALLGPAMAANQRAMREREPGNPAMARYEQVAAMAGAKDATAWVDSVRQALPIPRLREYGIGEMQAAGIVDAARRASSMRGNAVQLTLEELTTALEEAI